jgi:thioredoxin reductase
MSCSEKFSMAHVQCLKVIVATWALGSWVSIARAMDVYLYGFSYCPVVMGWGTRGGVDG